jgi:hypothetical protein
MRCEVRRRSQRDGSRWASLLTCRGDSSAPFTSPLGLLPFERYLQGFSTPDHPVRNRWRLNHSACATASLRFSSCSGPLPSGLGHADDSRVAVSRGRSPSGLCGELPRHVHSSAVGPCLRTPPRCRRLSRCRWRNLPRLSACALREASGPIRGSLRSRLAGRHGLNRATG